MSDVVFCSARELARRIRDRELTALEVLEAFLERVAERNGDINAVVVLDAERARARARDADAATARGESWGPLHGLPMTVKDAYQTAGIATTMGIPWERHVPTHNAALVQRVVDAGAIVFGKTNLPFAGYDWQTNNPGFGRCRNPYDRSRVPGGSSGGSCAALASGMTPLELGSDVAGSIRVPSGFCGVTGLRPTEGLLSGEGHGVLPGRPRSLRNLLVCGPLAREVGDLQLALEVLADPAPSDIDAAPSSALAPAELGDELRVAWTDELGGIRAAQSIRHAMVEFAAKLEAAGHRVSRSAPDIDFHDAQEVWGLVQAPELIALFPAPLRWLPARLLYRVGIVALLFGSGHLSRGVSRGATQSIRRHLAAKTRRDALIARAETFLRAQDAWLCPVAPVTAFTHRRTGAPLEIDGVRHAYGDAMGLFNCPIAAFGCPVVTIPIGRDDDGLPIGVQIVGPRWSDSRLLAVARRLEEIAGGFTPPPE